MMRAIRRSVMRALAYLFSDERASRWARVFNRKLVEQVRSAATDKFLELLLVGMDSFFLVSKSFRKNIEGFRATYVFESANGTVHATALFDNADMNVKETADKTYTARVTFQDGAALRAFLFSKNQDILDSLLKNQVTVDGNLNYIYKFGFMAKDLMRRLGMD